MIVLINALSARQGGGQTYLHNLLKFVPKDIDVRIFVLAPDSFKLENTSNISRLRIRWPVKNPFLRAIWERLKLPLLLRKIKADILFCPGGVVSTPAPERCKTVTMFRNMIPFDLAQRKKYPIGYRRLRNWILRRVMLQSMVKADLVIFISEYARKVIESSAGRSLKMAVVIPHGINPQFRINQNVNVVQPEWLPSEGYLLYVSTLDVYKAQVEVVQAFALLKHQYPIREKLILAGPENPEYGRKVRAEIERLGLVEDVIVIGSIPYETLPTVYQNALVNIFASESENCPNILLEALAAGRPVVSSNRPPMPEFGGESVVYFDPSSPADLAEKLASIINDPAYVDMLSKKAVEHSIQYDWNKAASLTWNAIKDLHRNEIRQ